MSEYAFNHNILVWAREFLNITLQELSEQLNVSPKTIELWETGNAKPSLQQLRQISEIVQKPLEIFFYTETPNIPKPIDIYYESYGNQINKFPSKIVKIIYYVQQFQHKLSDLTVPKFVGAKTLLNFDIKHQNFKNYSDIFEYIREFCMNCGIFVIKKSFKTNKYFGLCICSNTYPVICINANISYKKQLYTLFKELYCIVKNVNNISCIDNLSYVHSKLQKIDCESDKFALIFLKTCCKIISNSRKSYDTVIDTFGLQYVKLVIENYNKYDLDDHVVSNYFNIPTENLHETIQIIQNKI